MAQVNLDTASRLDIICRKGDTFELGIEFGVDFGDSSFSSGWKMEVRMSDTASTTVYESSDFTIARQPDESSGALAYEKGKLKISAANTAIDTSGLFVYDLQHTDLANNTTKTYLYGTFKVNEDITV